MGSLFIFLKALLWLCFTVFYPFRVSVSQLYIYIFREDQVIGGAAHVEGTYARSHFPLLAVFGRRLGIRIPEGESSFLHMDCHFPGFSWSKVLHLGKACQGQRRTLKACGNLSLAQIYLADFGTSHITRIGDGKGKVVADGLALLFPMVSPALAIMLLQIVQVCFL